MSDDPRTPLTPAEREVADARGRGLNGPQIAEWLGISVATVYVHIRHISAKLPEHDLDPMDAVLIWAAHRRWLSTHNRVHGVEDAA